LLRDAFRVFPGLFDDLFGLFLGGLHGLAVGRGRLGQPLGGRGRIGQLLAHQVLPGGHHLAHRRHGIAPDDEHDEGETAQLSEKSRHLFTLSRRRW
jgi:hypothetical protein